MTIPVDDVCTHQDLADEIGGTTALADLLPADWSGASTKARERALADVLRVLAKRSPPVRAADLADVTELKAAVAYGAAEFLYRWAATTPDSIHESRRKLYSDLYEGEIEGLAPTLIDDLRGTVNTITVSRR